MPSEAEVKCSNPKCGYFSLGQVCTKCGTLTPPQAEVVASSRESIPKLEQEKREASARCRPCPTAQGENPRSPRTTGDTMNKPMKPEEIGKRTLAQEERNHAANQDMARAAKENTMGIKETHIMVGFLQGKSSAEAKPDHREILLAIARRLRLLEAVHVAASRRLTYNGFTMVPTGGATTDNPAFVAYRDARAALDADERGGKAT